MGIPIHPKDSGGQSISTRPGRVDTVIYVGHMDRANRMNLARRVLIDWPEEIDPLVNSALDVTPIQFQEMCLQVAYRRMHEERHTERCDVQP